MIRGNVADSQQTNNIRLRDVKIVIIGFINIYILKKQLKDI